MINIIGTDKIKGVVDLTGINMQLKTGDNFRISEEQFYDHTVQLAVSMGLISYEKARVADPDGEISMIKCKNIYDRPLRINALNGEVRPGETFSLTDDQINGPDIRGALAKGMIEIVSSARSIETDEADVRVGNIFKEDTKSDPEEKPELRYIETESDHLETNEEVADPSVIESDDPPPVEKWDIPDPKINAVVWNPNHDPVAHTRNSMKAIAADKVGNVEMIETNVEVGDLKFVDQELDEKRREAHPVLKDKPVANTDGIDFL